MQPEPFLLSDPDRLRLAHIVRSAHEAVVYLGPMDAVELARDGMRTRALVNCFTEIGEAARQVSAEQRQRMPDIPWRQIVNMRNVVVHVYWNVTLNIIVSTIRDDLPGLIAAVQRALGPPPRGTPA